MGWGPAPGLAAFLDKVRRAHSVLEGISALGAHPYSRGSPVQFALVTFLFAHRARDTTAGSPDVPDQSDGEETGQEESNQANGSHHACSVAMGGMQQD